MMSDTDTMIEGRWEGNTCAIAPMPRGCSSNSSQIVSKLRPSKAFCMIRLVADRRCAFTLEWSFDIYIHISAGNISVLEAAHCPSYHQSPDTNQVMTTNTKQMETLKKQIATPHQRSILQDLNKPVSN